VGGGGWGVWGGGEGGGERGAGVVGQEDDVEWALGGAQVERVGQAKVDERGGGGGGRGPGGRRGVGIPGAVGVQGAEAGDEIGAGEGQILSLGQGSEGGAGFGLERDQRAREAGVDGVAELVGHLIFGQVMVGGYVVDGAQSRERTPGAAQQARDNIHRSLRFDK